jgi:hypothetical protein
MKLLLFRLPAVRSEPPQALPPGNNPHTRNTQTLMMARLADKTHQELIKVEDPDSISTSC